jgi:hypothetical protein
MAIYLFNVKTFVFPPSFVVPPLIKRERLGFFYNCCSLTNCRYIVPAPTTQKAGHIVVMECLPRRCIASLRRRQQRKRRPPIVALRVFSREVFNGQLPSNAVTIHVTILKYLHTKCWSFSINSYWIKKN